MSIFISVYDAQLLESLEHTKAGILANINMTRTQGQTLFDYGCSVVDVFIFSRVIATDKPTNQQRLWQ